MKELKFSFRALFLFLFLYYHTEVGMTTGNENFARYKIRSGSNKKPAFRVHFRSLRSKKEKHWGVDLGPRKEKAFFVFCFSIQAL